MTQGSSATGQADLVGRDRWRRWAWVWFILAVLLQLYAVYAPEQPKVGSGIPHLDKLVHATIFALPVALGLVASRGWWPLAAVIAVHAPVSEMVQARLLSHRAGDPLDLVADLVGVAIGSLVWRSRAATADRLG